MAEFEQACADLDIALFVLPPKKPQYNGGVERSDRTFREEFYARLETYLPILLALLRLS